MSEPWYVQAFMKGFFTMRIVTLLVIGSTVYMWLSGLPISELQKNVTLIIIGFWFNSEITKEIIMHLIEENKELRRMIKQ